jgi:hypothetical protein
MLPKHDQHRASEQRFQDRDTAKQFLMNVGHQKKHVILECPRGGKGGSSALTMSLWDSVFLGHTEVNGQRATVDP